MPKFVKDKEKTPSVAVPDEVKSVKPANLPHAVRGFKDVLPQEQRQWGWVTRTLTDLAEALGYGRIDLPVLEETSLFVRAVGRHTDIVTKEMFSFIDPGGENLSLRPEATPGVVRAYLEHGFGSQPQPVRLFYLGPMFRRERPQHGRYRQFTQFGAEVIGSPAPIVDAQLIAMFAAALTALGLKGFSVQVNSIGCATCREIYKRELTNYYKAKRRLLCEDCKKRLVRNPLRLLDCKVPSDRQLAQSAPQILDWIDEACKNHFMSVLELLDALEVSYVLNPYLVRGLDYYTRTVFEVWPTEGELGAQAALGGGGRYDDLVKLMGGLPTPAAGFALGVERVILQQREQHVEPPVLPKPDVYVAQIGTLAKVKALKLFGKLRAAGLRVAETFTKDSLKAQLEVADKLKVRYVVILGQKEVLDSTVLLRDMEGGMQEIVDYDKVVADLLKKLRGNGNGVEPVAVVGAPEGSEAPAPATRGRGQQRRIELVASGGADEGLEVPDEPPNADEAEGAGGKEKTDDAESGDDDAEDGDGSSGGTDGKQDEPKTEVEL